MIGHMPNGRRWNEVRRPLYQNMGTDTSLEEDSGRMSTDNSIPFLHRHTGDPEPRRFALVTIVFRWREGAWRRGLFFDEQMILISKAKGGKSRYVPILPELAQELRTHLGARTHGHLFETIHSIPYSPRRIQQIIKETAEEAKITTRVYPHLLRHSVATTLLERGMPMEQIQKFLGHSKLETTQIYAESSPEMIKDSYQRALGG
jgi:integrase